MPYLTYQHHERARSEPRANTTAFVNWSSETEP